MHIVLRALMETEDSLEPGDVIGEIVTEGDSERVLVSDEALKSRLEALLLEGLTAYSGDSSGTRMATVARTVRPGDPAYFGALRDRLEEKDFRLQAEMQ